MLGGFVPGPGDGAPVDCAALLLLGPGAGFWAHLTASPEYADGAPDPLDRWSRRVIGGLARDVGAEPLFPFDGPPWRPFIAWAKRTGRAWDSPVGMLVHATEGLFVSYRGALAFRTKIELPAPLANPCPACAAPCRDACPVGALGPGGYDVPRCHGYLDTEPGRDCLERGCAARRACPVGARSETQSGFHMAAFHPAAIHGRQGA